jgi:hypothetical protein
MEPPENILPQDIPPQAVLPQTSPLQAIPSQTNPPQATLQHAVPSQQENFTLIETKFLSPAIVPQQVEVQDTSYQQAAAPMQHQGDSVQVLIPPEQTFIHTEQGKQASILPEVQQPYILPDQPHQVPTLPDLAQTQESIPLVQAPILPDPAQQAQQTQQTQQAQQAAMQAALDKQSEFHGDYTTVILTKPSPRGTVIKVVAHLGLPGGALMRIFYDF